MKVSYIVGEKIKIRFLKKSVNYFLALMKDAKNFYKFFINVTTFILLILLYSNLLRRFLTK